MKVSATEMEDALLGSETTSRRCVCTSRTSGHFLWMDTHLIQYHRGSGSCFCRSRCLCGVYLIFAAFEANANKSQFLTFFKMAIKFLSVAFILATAVILPINNHFYGYEDPFRRGKPRKPDNQSMETYFETDGFWMIGSGKHEKDTRWLWTYLVFTYVFTALVIYLIITHTKTVIRVRQDYLGSQSTITDRTIKLSGIPKELRSEDKIEETLEKLEIGKVESITLCRDWQEIDELMDQRAWTIRKLEESWTVHLSRKKDRSSLDSVPVRRPISPSERQEEDHANDIESDNLLGDSGNHIAPLDKLRPTTRMWYGFLKLQSKKVDAIDYHEEQLRKIDEKIKIARKKVYKAVPLAFVTMDSIPACQMAVQALLDPKPMQLLATLAPSPSDIVWANTYLPRNSRMIRSWFITVVVIFLSIIWLIPVAALAPVLNLCSIEKVAPRLAVFLAEHEITKALVQTGLPTLVVSLLNIAVPYLYDFLANMQGMISQSEVELSVISKNFFFTFFNVFLVFTVFTSATNIWETFKDSLSDTTLIAYTLAKTLRGLRVFYANFILLQGIGLFPLRLLEFGSVSMYPIMRMGAKTPRDYAELVQPPIFKYGFYLPTAILIFILCIVYSILPSGFMMLLFGLFYFVIGYFTYKYQLLYAMDHPQHATGRAWTMICYRIMVGLGVFQLAMAGVIGLQTAITPAVAVIPLILFTIWFSYFFGRTYEPLTKYIALRSIQREENSDMNIADEDVGDDRPSSQRRPSTTIDEAREKGQRFVNPSLIVP